MNSYQSKTSFTKTSHRANSFPILKQEGIWYLIFTAGILPFIMRMYVYHIGAEEESWFPLDNDLMADFFSHGKSICFLVLTILMTITLYWRYFTANSHKPEKKQWIWAFLFLGFCILSTLCSVNKRDSLWGNYGRFETIFVQIGYLVLCLLSYYMAENPNTFKILFSVILLVSFFMVILGLLQALGHDPFLTKGAQKLLIPMSQWKQYLGHIDRITESNAVYLTLGNSNTASMYLALLIILCCGYFFCVRGIWRFLTGALTIGLFTVMILTNARTGLFMVILSLLTALLLFRKHLLAHWKQTVCLFLAMALLFGIVDGFRGFSLTSRLAATIRSFKTTYTAVGLTSIKTMENAVEITKDQDSISFTYELGSDLTDGGFQLFDKTGRNIAKEFDANTGKLHNAGWNDITFFTEEVDEERFLVMKWEDTLWYFTRVDEAGYMIYTGNGKYDTVSDVAHTGFAGMEHMASGRLYIWSRSLPLLKTYWLTGSGPDTFYQIFPQNDYVGKAIFTPSALTVVEKPHSMYLQIALQNGLPSLFCLLLFFGQYIRGFFNNVSDRISTIDFSCNSPQQSIYSTTIFLLVVAFLCGSIFNDSTIGVSPLFYMMLGFGIRLNEKLS